MPPDSADPDATAPYPERVLLDSRARPRRALQAEQAELSPEQKGEDDRLEPAGVHTRRIVLFGVGLLVFIAVALSLLLLYFNLTAGNLGAADPQRFPTPRLETNINPRVLPAVEPGAAQAFMPVTPRADPETLQRAMQAIAAKGAHAYDPLPGAPPPPPTPSLAAGAPQ